MEQHYPNRIILNVPYAEKAEAKNLGARWDPEIRKWFVPEGVDEAAFSKWLEEED